MLNVMFNFFIYLQIHSIYHEFVVEKIDVGLPS